MSLYLDSGVDGRQNKKCLPFFKKSTQKFARIGKLTYLCTVLKNNTVLEVNNRSIRLTVRTADSQSANTSSILVWSTKAERSPKAASFFVLSWRVVSRWRNEKARAAAAVAGQDGVHGTLLWSVRGMATDGWWCVMSRWLRRLMACRAWTVGQNGVHGTLLRSVRGMATDGRWCEVEEVSVAVGSSNMGCGAGRICRDRLQSVFIRERDRRITTKRGGRF